MDSTPKGICIYEFMYVYVCKQMLHYIDIHLEDKSMIPFFLHVGVNDFLNDNSKSNVNNLMLNIHKTVEKCKEVGVRNIFLFGLVYTTRVSLPMLQRVHGLISNYYRENAFILITEISEGFVCIKMAFIF